MKVSCKSARLDPRVLGSYADNFNAQIQRPFPNSSDAGGNDDMTPTLMLGIELSEEI